MIAPRSVIFRPAAQAALLLLLAAAGSPAQPVIYAGGIVNAAGYLQADSPGGAIAQGSIFSIFGARLGPSQGVQASAFPLDAALGGVQVVLVPPSGSALAAIPLFVSDGQINAILPSATPVGQVRVAVRYSGRESNPQPIKVVRSSFGIFAGNGAGAGPASAQNYLSVSEQPLNSPVNVARPGQTIVLWGTGLGPIETPDYLTPTPGNLSEPVEVTIGGRPAAIDYAGRSGCCAGVDQINFRLPADTPRGCAVPLVVKVQNSIYSNIATIAVDAGGQPCADPWNLLGSTRRWGEIGLVRTVSDAGTTDSFAGVFGAGDPPVPFPPLGACASAPLSQAGRLDAGQQLTLAGPQSSRQIPRDGASGRYLVSGGPPFLGPGPYTLTGSGGADIGPVNVTLIAGSPLFWNAFSGTRSGGVTLGWSGGEAQNGFVTISGPGFLCTADLRAGSTSLPAAVLANLPAQAAISVASVTRAIFSTQGLDQGILSYTHAVTRVVRFGAPPLASSPVVLPSGQRILAELATTAVEQERGLMQRTDLAPDRGMLFLFNSPSFLPFWMYQTLLPLDIIWMDQNRRIVFISANTPPCPSANSSNCPLYGGKELSQYVLEIGAGRAQAYGLRLGDQLNW